MIASHTSAKRAEILAVSRELLQTRGFNAFSHRDLADRVGVKSSTVHYYFPTKEDIGVALIREYMAETLALFEELGGTADPQARLEAYCRLFEETAALRDRICTAGMLASDYCTLGESLRDEVKSYYACVERWLAAQASALEPKRTAAESASLARLALALLEGALLSARLFGEPERVGFAGQSLRTMLGPAKTGRPK